MVGAWRYTTGLDCIRHWRWYPVVGRALRPTLIACVRGAALGVPLLVGPQAGFWPGGGGGAGWFPTEYGAAAPWFMPSGMGGVALEYPGGGGGYGWGVPVGGGFNAPGPGFNAPGPGFNAEFGTPPLGPVPAHPVVPTDTPEPASLAILAAGLIAAASARMRA